MISYQSRTVLNHLKELADNTDTELALLGMSTLICPTDDEDRTYDYSEYEGEINSILDELVNAGYLTYPRNNRYFVSLTSKGIHPMQGLYFSFLNFLFRSILVPISVSAITTIVLFFIEHWLMH